MTATVTDLGTIDAGTIATKIAPNDVMSLAIDMGALNGTAITAGNVRPTVATQVWWAVLAERRAAEAVHGIQRLPLGTGTPEDKVMADRARAECDLLTANEDLTWRAIIREEAYEAFAEEDPTAFVAEAVQAIGTLLAAIENAVHDNPDLSIPPPF
jgi:hypothetical protein